MTDEARLSDPRELAIEVSKHFLIFNSEEFLKPVVLLAQKDSPCADCFASASEGLHSVLSAASLPFQLVQNSVYQRRFDRFHAAESILALIPREPGSGLSEACERMALKSANEKMEEFLESVDGREFMRDHIIIELGHRLVSKDVKIAAQEQLIQSLISTWSVFESFARSFVVEWVNQDPNRALSLLASPELKDFFGKKAVDIQIIGNHGFDLSRSMGAVLFKDRRLDSLANIRSTMKALFSASNVIAALGDQLWLLNQRRHLFVHKRGIVDAAYFGATGDNHPLGVRMELTWDDVKQHLWAVQSALLAIGAAAKIEAGSERSGTQNPKADD